MGATPEDVTHGALKQMIRRDLRTTPVLPRYWAVIQCHIPVGRGKRIRCLVVIAIGPQRFLDTSVMLCSKPVKLWANEDIAARRQA